MSRKHAREPWVTIPVKRPGLTPARAEDIVRPTVLVTCKALRAASLHPRQLDAHVAREVAIDAFLADLAQKRQAVPQDYVAAWRDGGALADAFDRLWAQAQAQD